MNIKRLVLGTAAGALAVTGAQAADLPVVVEPIEYVRVCDAYGTGFFYIPGTETCLRVRGRIRTDYNVYFDMNEGDGLFENRGFDDTDDTGYRFRARGYVRLDSRTATEFGLLRTYLDLFGTVDNAGDTSMTLDSAFIQFGGLTFGRTSTFYGYSGGVYVPEQTFDLGNNTGQVNVVAYTFAFGNGFSASLALEDNVEHRVGVRGLTEDYVTPGPGENFTPFINYFATDLGYGGAQIPDVVANVRVDQGWGSAQLMAAGHYVNSQGTFTRVTGNPAIPAQTTVRTVNYDESAYGFAVGAGVEVNVPFGNGTTVGLQGGYAKGALDYIADAPTCQFGCADAVVIGNGDLKLGDFFSVVGGFTTSFTPTVALAAGAGYTYGDNAGELYDFQNINAQAFLAYEPVDDFVMGVGVEYRYAENSSNIEDLGNGDDGDALTAFFRAQRDF